MNRKTPYSTEPRPDIAASASPIIGKSRTEIHAIRNAALARQDFQTYQAATYAMTLLSIAEGK